LVYPLFALKWCMILLNEFIPHDLERRIFSGEKNDERNVLKKRQLLKAEKMISTIKEGSKSFPFRMES